MLTRDASISPAIAELPVSLLLEERTGPVISSAELTALAMTTPREDTAGTLKLHMALLGAILGTGGAYTATATEQIIHWHPATMAVVHAGPAKLVLPTLAGSIDLAFRIPDRYPDARPQAPKPSTKAHIARAGVAPADELRTLTGLSPQLLGNLFGVSRTTYYKWIEGATPRDTKYSHLLEVLSHVRDVSGRIAPFADLAPWLRTPVSPGGRSPLDYLRDRRYTAFRGFALRAASGEMALGVPRPALRDTNLGADERAAARRRINPTPRSPESDTEDV
jgi:hypothetical protein